MRCSFWYIFLFHTLYKCLYSWLDIFFLFLFYLPCPIYFFMVWYQSHVSFTCCTTKQLFIFLHFVCIHNCILFLLFLCLLRCVFCYLFLFHTLYKCLYSWLDHLLSFLALFFLIPFIFFMVWNLNHVSFNCNCLLLFIIK